MKFLTRSKKALVLSIGLLVISAPVKAQLEPDYLGNTIHIHLEEIESGKNTNVSESLTELKLHGHTNILNFLDELSKQVGIFSISENRRILKVFSMALKHGISLSILNRLKITLDYWKGKDHLLKQLLIQVREHLDKTITTVDLDITSGN